MAWTERPPRGHRVSARDLAATWEKVLQNPEVRKVLLATGDLVLTPDHIQEPNAPAAWRYNEILTSIRTELQKRRTP
jgi:hypothetical protein